MNKIYEFWPYLSYELDYFIGRFIRGHFNFSNWLLSNLIANWGVKVIRKY